MGVQGAKAGDIAYTHAFGVLLAREAGGVGECVIIIARHSHVGAVGKALDRVRKKGRLAAENRRLRIGNCLSAVKGNPRLVRLLKKPAE